MSGASGAIYGIRLLQVLAELKDVETHLVISTPARETIRLETEYKVEQVEAMAHHVYAINNIAAAIASGSFKTDGMVVIPCSIDVIRNNF